MSFNNAGCGVKPEYSQASEQWIIKEIQAMMHGFGDCSSPLFSTARLIEEVMLKQLRSAVQQAIEIAALRGSVIVKSEDFIFLMRKDPVKVKRLLKYLDVKNTKMSEYSKLEGALNDSDSDFLDVAMLNVSPSKRRRKDFRDFSTNGNGDRFDTVKHERLVRADRVASSLDSTKYAEFSRSRRASFTNSANKVIMLHDEVLKSMKDLPPATRLNKSACDILGYFAFETVAQIVDLAFLVRQDAAAQTNDPFSRYTSALTIHPSSSAYVPVGTIGAAPPLSPMEVREALRRYWSPRFSPFNSSSHLHKRLLAC